MDVDRNGVFNTEVDRVDSFEIIGFSVIPEVPFGTIMCLLSMFVVLVAFVIVKRSRQSSQS